MLLEIQRGLVIKDTMNQNRFSNVFSNTIRGSSSESIRKNFKLNELDIQVVDFKNNSKFPLSIFDKTNIDKDNVCFIYIVVLNKNEKDQESLRFDLKIGESISFSTTEFCVTNCKDFPNGLIIESVNNPNNIEAELVIYIGS